MRDSMAVVRYAKGLVMMLRVAYGAMLKWKRVASAPRGQVGWKEPMVE